MYPIYIHYVHCNEKLNAFFIFTFSRQKCHMDVDIPLLTMIKNLICYTNFANIDRTNLCKCLT
jgi:hypothetical protein